MYGLECRLLQLQRCFIVLLAYFDTITSPCLTSGQSALCHLPAKSEASKEYNLKRCRYSNSVLEMTFPTTSRATNEEDSIMEDSSPPPTALQGDETPRESASGSTRRTNSSLPSKKRSLDKEADDGRPSKTRSPSPAFRNTARVPANRIFVSPVPQVNIPEAERSAPADRARPLQGNTLHAEIRGTRTEAIPRGAQLPSQPFLTVPATDTREDQRARRTGTGGKEQQE